MTKARRERKGRRKEREGKEKEEDRCSQLRTSVQGHTRERGEPEYYTQEHPNRRRGKRRRVGGGRRVRFRQVPTNLQNTLTALVTLCPAKMAGCLDRYGHVKA